VINAIVFDMDGVLCRYRIERRLAILASWSGQSPDAIHAAIWRSGFEDEAERGVVSADEYLRGFGERMGYPLSAAQWVEARRAAIEPDLAVLSLARQLSTDHPVGMFTNNPLLLKRHISRRPGHLRHARDLFRRTRAEQAGPGGVPPSGRPPGSHAR
jgi:putative hydrolase of the HAD superfamily